jgi:O-antigen/teichoic acid export membrane protein
VTDRLVGLGARFPYQGYRNADYFLVGKLLGVEALGIYRIAFDLGMQPVEVVINLINRVSYPIYVKLAHDGRALEAACSAAHAR